MRARPLISVVTPAYNARNTLARAHQSLFRQNANWEHIIVNDGSTDGTADVIAQLAGDSRVIPVERGNGGPGAALNSGLHAAGGEFVAFLDADDEYGPDHLDLRLAALDAAGADLLWGGVEVIAERAEDTVVPDVEKGFGFVPVSECVVQGTLFGRTNVFKALRFSEDRRIWWQDYELVRRAVERYHVVRFHVPTYRYYRGSGTSLTDSISAAWPLGSGEPTAAA